MRLRNLLTAPLSLCWGAVAVVRGKLFDWHVLSSKHFDLPILSVGNLAVGGTGKTPHVEYLLRLLHAQGYEVGMLSRGYGRRTKGYLLAHAEHTAAEIGDEPFQVAKNCPFAHVAVCEKRVVGVERLRQDCPGLQVIVLDDAYQHRYVTPGLQLLLTAANRLYTHDHLLPLGRLREPASAARRASAVIVTKCVAGERPSLKVESYQSLFYSQVAYGAIYPYQSTFATSLPTSVQGQSVIVLAGVAHPEAFYQHVMQQGAAEAHLVSFPDHHAFRPTDAQRVLDAWQQCKGPTPIILTTQKDAARIDELLKHLPATVRQRLMVQPITVSIEPSKETKQSFNQYIINYVKSNSRNSCVD